MKIRSMRYRKMGVTPYDFEIAKNHIVGNAFTLGEVDMDNLADTDQKGEDSCESSHDERDHGDSLIDLFIISKNN